MDKDEFDPFDDDFIQLDELSQNVSQACQIHQAVSSYGIDPSSKHLLVTAGLLSSVGLESLSFHSPTDTETHIALESLGQTINDKVSKWSSKLLSIFSTKWQSYLDGSKKIHTAIVEKIGKLTASKLGDPQEAKKFVEVHPISKVLIAVETALAAIAIIGAASIGMGGLLKAASRLPFLQSIASKINALKWPFGKITAVLSKHTGKITLGVAAIGAATVISMDQAGYTKKAVTALGDKVDTGITKFGENWPAIKTKTTTIAKGIASTAKASAYSAVGGFKGGYHTIESSPTFNPSATRGGEWSMVTTTIGGAVGAVTGTVGAVIPIIGALGFVLFQLVKKVILATWQLVSNTLDRLRNPKDNIKEFI